MEQDRLQDVLAEFHGAGPGLLDRIPETFVAELVLGLVVRVENASLVRSDGSRADFSIDAPLDKKDSISVKASLHDFDLATLVHAALPSELALANRYGSD